MSSPEYLVNNFFTPAQVIGYLTFPHPYPTIVRLGQARVTMVEEPLTMVEELLRIVEELLTMVGW